MLQVVNCKENVVGFGVLPHRWVVERTNGWLLRTRRLAHDHERTIPAVRGRGQ
ncbi:hypothetical protein O1Q96_20950 [Streptomyces sp. Qhu-G9]|uniref:hypothetical protein n=1 Tax=Streptomyces sp. Qhu-G9 TaxID=3452799 RepID=UPI0022AC5126|nr:hypothetical protein [Streptomyces aurantiacus]WAU86672.1 hypothetical protein O1Q96_20950 [Streptomyces aurantiacus]